MAEFRILVISTEQADADLMRALAHVLCYEEPAQVGRSVQFWTDWFSAQIPGEKFTFAAEECGISVAERKFVGVARLWKTPYCDNKWLLEGLEVIPPRRRRGIGTALLKKAIGVLADLQVPSLSAQIHRNNGASIALHRSLGFEKLSSGSRNSFGEYREQSDEYVLKVEEAMLDV